MGFNYNDTGYDYHGWTNYETWFFKLYLSECIGDEELSHRAKEFVADNADAAEGMGRDYAIAEMAKYLEEIIDEIENYERIDSTLIHTLYKSARDRINIPEIAESYIDL